MTPAARSGWLQESIVTSEWKISRKSPLIPKSFQDDDHYSGTRVLGTHWSKTPSFALKSILPKKIQVQLWNFPTQSISDFLGLDIDLGQKYVFLDQCVSTTVFWSSPPPIVTQYRIFSSEILSILEMMKKVQEEKWIFKNGSW